MAPHEVRDAASTRVVFRAPVGPGGVTTPLQLLWALAAQELAEPRAVRAGATISSACFLPAWSVCGHDLIAFGPSVSVRLKVSC